MRSYLELTKPGITLFIGVSAGSGFVAAQNGIRDPLLLVAALAATMIMSGGAAALNHVAERHGDALMRRTAKRPLPSGALNATRAALFGWSLSFAGLALSLLTLPPAATLFLVLSHLSYVYLYTPLKRRTPFCTLAGALPGALPVLAGWCATGAPVNAAALALASVLYLWQIPHFLAIGWLGREDYAKAGCPMLGVVDPSGRSSAVVSFLYAVGMGVAAVLVQLATPAGWLYGVFAVAVGGGYVVMAWRFLRQTERLPARQLFLSSLLVLPLLLGALVLDLMI